MAIRRWNANTSTWELVGNPGTVSPASIGAAALVGDNLFSGKQTFTNGRALFGKTTDDTYNTIQTQSTFGLNGVSGYYSELNHNLYYNNGWKNITQGPGSQIMLFGGANLPSYISFMSDTNGTSTSAGSPANLVERMRIDSSGRVGIGNTSPTSTIDVLGLQANTSATSANGPTGTLRLGFNGGDAAGNYGSSLVFSQYWWSNSTMQIAVGQITGVKTAGSGNFGGGLAFFTSNGSNTDLSERMRINDSGYMLVGYTSSNGAYRLQVNSQIFATSSSIATSDGRYKENISSISSGLDIIDSLNPVSFNWKEHAVHNFPEGKTVGFIAQEVKEALKDYDWVNNIVKSNYNEEADEEFLGIAESNIIPLLVAAVKELRAEVKELKAKL